MGRSFVHFVSDLARGPPVGVERRLTAWLHAIFEHLDAAPPGPSSRVPPWSHGRPRTFETLSAGERRWAAIVLSTAEHIDRVGDSAGDFTLQTIINSQNESDGAGHAVRAYLVNMELVNGETGGSRGSAPSRSARSSRRAEPRLWPVVASHRRQLGLRHRPTDAFSLPPRAC